MLPGPYFFVSGHSIKTLFMLPSAGFNYFRALELPYQAAKNEFWVSLAVINGLGLFFLLLAALIAPRAWQDKPAGAKKTALARALDFVELWRPQ